MTYILGNLQFVPFKHCVQGDLAPNGPEVCFSSWLAGVTEVCIGRLSNYCTIFKRNAKIITAVAAFVVVCLSYLFASSRNWRRQNSPCFAASIRVHQWTLQPGGSNRMLVSQKNLMTSKHPVVTSRWKHYMHSIAENNDRNEARAICLPSRPLR